MEFLKHTAESERLSQKAEIERLKEELQLSNSNIDNNEIKNNNVLVSNNNHDKHNSTYIIPKSPYIWYNPINFIGLLFYDQKNYNLMNKSEIIKV